VAADNSRQQERQISFEKGKRSCFLLQKFSAPFNTTNEKPKKNEANVDKRRWKERKKPVDNNEKKRNVKSQ
jgi:hypothetical protein